MLGMTSATATPRLRWVGDLMGEGRGEREAGR